MTPPIDAPLSYQAQCHACDWASVLHLAKKHAAEDAEVHENVWHHMGEIVTITAVDQIRKTQ